MNLLKKDIFHLFCAHFFVRSFAQTKLNMAQNERILAETEQDVAQNSWSSTMTERSSCVKQRRKKKKKKNN